MGSNPQRWAWATVLGGFVIFCLLCIGIIVFAQWLIFKSPTELNATLHVGSGTVGLAEPNQSDEKVVRTQAQVGTRDILTTDNLSQGYLSFDDPYSSDTLATVMLRSDSVMSLENASRPRFSLSDNPYSIHLIGVNGRLEVSVSCSLKREIRLDIEGPVGRVRIGECGRYLIDSTPTSLQISALSGSATLLTRNGSRTQHIAASFQGALDASGAIQVDPGPVELLPNSTFERVGPTPGDLNPNSTAAQNDTDDWPVEWSCYTFSDNPTDPEGRFVFTTYGGRRVIRITRVHDPEPSHGQTGCIQYLAGPDGLNVLKYNSLRLRVTMQVNYQQLSACGDRGSECPVMLHMTYWDINGNPREWFHGFYAEYIPNLGSTRCDSCLEEHERINKGGWYVYESGNLLTDLPQDLRPGSIISVEFYVSGHGYDVMLNEVSLLASGPAVLNPTTGAQ